MHLVNFLWNRKLSDLIGRLFHSVMVEETHKAVALCFILPILGGVKREKVK
jgi:hypothetical protein